ncbi:hypothetical protein PV325_008659 [Microctonus aethiopoides]|uniref:Copper transport protein ATOX1 n=1 Tax=Microctonus aethiopoides TaxID=144406 RepID=A0AA39FUE4_9HYME|nr:hypothetical protein PV325_008659 [Microctonus aethiopoides]KAK0095386.1 hypothetical protein PV326_008512 [Microctonus aethiopoides]KAK0176025.1 hypothetical protein PV328_000204 [Microctonus aethiopoides]
MASKVYEFNVEMTCQGCSNAVERVLGKKAGVENFKINLEEKKVFVTSTLSPEEVLESIKKTGKTVSYIGVQS